MKSTAVSIRQVRKLRPRGRFIHLRAADLSSGLLDLGVCVLSTSRGHWGLGTDSIRKPGKAQRTPTGVSASHRLLIPRGQRFRAVCRAAEPYVLPTADKAQRSLGLSLPQSEALFDSVWEGFVRQRGVEVQDCRKRLSSALSQETLVL